MEGSVANLPKDRARTGAGARKASRAWWSVHQWVGLKLSIFMSFVLLTGTLAVFSNEIDWLLDPNLRVARATSADQSILWAEAAASIQAALPEARIVSLDAPVDQGFAMSAFVRNEDGAFRRALADPYTGKFIATAPRLNAQTVLRRLHRHLFMPIKFGVPIVSSLSILLLISLVTSFVVYKKWWRGFFKPMRVRDARTLMGDFHRLAGLWSLWFVALIALTGVWYLVESLGGRAPGHPSAKVAPVDIPPAEIGDALARSLDAAREANPDLRIGRIMFPTAKSGAFVIQGQDKAILVRERANAVWIDAATGEATMTVDARDLSVHQRISEAADPLHFGYFGGLATKLIWFVFGAAMTALSLSGAAIYSLRLLRETRAKPTVGAVAGRAVAGAGWWAWPSAGLVVAGFAFWIIVAAKGL
ncbi:MAG: PepSY domain-containing protein [Alphaproteobacteria bacterium]|nr:PepSY domain-containing protein [Alphaproteobacteria bacterium]